MACTTANIVSNIALNKILWAAEIHIPLIDPYPVIYKKLSSFKSCNLLSKILRHNWKTSPDITDLQERKPKTRAGRLVLKNIQEWLQSNLPIKEPEITYRITGSLTVENVLKLIPLGSGENPRKAYVVTTAGFCLGKKCSKKRKKQRKQLLGTPNCPCLSCVLPFKVSKRTSTENSRHRSFDKPRRYSTDWLYTNDRIHLRNPRKQERTCDENDSRFLIDAISMHCNKLKTSNLKNL